MSDKYKNGKIYTIRCKNDDSLIYVGSTVQPLFKRLHYLHYLKDYITYIMKKIKNIIH